MSALDSAVARADSAELTSSRFGWIVAEFFACVPRNSACLAEAYAWVTSCRARKRAFMYKFRVRNHFPLPFLLAAQFQFGTGM